MEPTLDPVPKRRHPIRFTVRAALIVTLLIGVPLGLYANRLRRQRAAVAEVLHAGGSVLYDYHRVISSKGNAYDPKAMPPGPARLRMFVGPEPFRSVSLVNLAGKHVTDADLEVLKGLPRLENLNLSNTRITNAGLAHLAGMTQLRYLSLWNTDIDDSGMRHLAGLTGLRQLILDETGITDEGLAHLGDMTEMEDWLGLTDTDVTDAGLVYLRGMTKLRSLNLLKTKVTPAGAKELGRYLPKTDISYER